MKIQNRLVWLGILIYVTSFFLTAVVGRGFPLDSVRGYDCAYVSLAAPWGRIIEIRSPGRFRWK
jgi:hypothetical protein